MYRSRKLEKHYNPDKSHKQLRKGAKKCPFCEDAGNLLVKNYLHASVIKNLYPYQYWEFMKVTSHLMVVPSRHIESLHDLTEDERAEVMAIIADYQEQGYNIYAREKDNSSKSVPHQHTHLIKTNNKRANFFLFLRKPYLLIRR
ncbi:MAG: hypothetical protein JWO41_531 [Candidatus Saccharibacteria bacterium]|nr:hypothetical protein [Candidatus Saccharibacteria bacterium]